jgi:putative membrane protein
MILKRQFTPVSMWPYARFELLLAAVAAPVAWALIDQARLPGFALPSLLATVLGTALSILLAVRVNTAYQRWWEASAIWGQITGLSRNLVRVVVTVTAAKQDADVQAVAAFQRDIARRQSAYTTALRIQLRATTGEERELDARLSDADRAALAGVDNRASVLLALQSARIHAAYGEQILTGLDNFQMETALAALSTQQALAERLTQQPVPRTYDVFSRYLVHLYVIAFPFAVTTTLPAHWRWTVIPATLIVAFAFRMLERIGQVVESPFGNTVHDLPITAIGTLIERDLLELTGQSPRPPAPQPVDGYLW